MYYKYPVTAKKFEIAHKRDKHCRMHGLTASILAPEFR
jgi:hypothetical protein